MVDQQPDAIDQSQSLRNTGIVYVLTNPEMPNCIKIGTTQKWPQRMKELDGTSVPVPFECMYAARVHDPKAWEKTLHYVFEDARINPKREFFSKDVAEKAIRIFENGAGRERLLYLNRRTVSAVSASRNSQTSRTGFNFEVLGIPIGAELQFIHNNVTTCTVTNQKPPKVNFRGEELPLSRATHKAFALEGLLHRSHEDKTEANPFDAINKGDPFDAISQVVNCAEALLCLSYYEGNETMAIDEANSMHDLSQGLGWWRYNDLTLAELYS